MAFIPPISIAICAAFFSRARGNVQRGLRGVDPLSPAWRSLERDGRGSVRDAAEHKPIVGKRANVDDRKAVARLDRRSRCHVAQVSRATASIGEDARAQGDKLAVDFRYPPYSLFIHIGCLSKLKG